VTIVTVSAKGRVLPDEAWERYLDISRWPEWAPQITRVDATADRLGFGVTGRVFGPLGVSVDFVVESVDHGARRWTWTVQRWPVTVHLEHAVGKQGGGSSTSLRLDGPLPVVVAYAPLARLALQRLVSKNPPVIATPDRDADGNLRG
jgi:hypothetical protein